MADKQTTTGQGHADVRAVLDEIKAQGRTALTAPEAKKICDSYGIAVPREGIAHSADEAAHLAESMGYPVVLKIVSPQILHKTEAGGVVVGVDSADAAKKAYVKIMDAVKAHAPKAEIEGIQVQQMLQLGDDGQEVIIGAMTDPSFGKLVVFGLGGILVEVIKDATFRLAPVTLQEATGMLDSIQAADMLKGVRGKRPVDREALAKIIVNVSKLVNDFPEIVELDLNPVFARPDGATAVDVAMVCDFNPVATRYRPSKGDIVKVMNRLMHPKSIAVIGASVEKGKIGNSVMANLIDGGYQGTIYPVHPKLDSVLGKKAYKSVKDIPGDVDVAVFAIPAKVVPTVLEQVGEKHIPVAVLIPSGFAETGNKAGQEEIISIARKHNIRLLGPNIYGYYYPPDNLCATFCTPYDVKGKTALSSQSGGIGMAILGFARSNKMGVSAIVGVGNKSDIDEDDLLAFFEQDDNTQVVAMHCEDIKDGRSFAEIARSISKTKPVVMLKGGRTAAGARAAQSHTAALAGNDKVYDDVFKQIGVIRAQGLLQMMQFAHGIPVLPTPKGENVIIITGAGGSGVLLSDACVKNGLSLMTMPADLDAAFRKYIPPFGASGNPIDITGGEPPSTYEKTIRLGLEDDRVHAIVLGYWHTIITPPMVFAKLVVKVVDEMKAKGINKPVVASLSGDYEVEQASAYLYEHGVVAYPYTTEIPVEVLAAKYRWARGAGLLR